MMNSSKMGENAIGAINSSNIGFQVSPFCSHSSHLYSLFHSIRIHRLYIFFTFALYYMKCWVYIMDVFADVDKARLERRKRTWYF